MTIILKIFHTTNTKTNQSLHECRTYSHFYINMRGEVIENFIFIYKKSLTKYKLIQEKARQQLHKNAASNIEQVLEATPHLPPITKNIQVRRTRHAGHCWRSRDELIRDVLLWTPTYGRAKAGRPARTYIQQLCEDTGCSPEDLPEAMNDREKWREMAWDIRAGGTTWWYIYIYIYI